MSGLKAGRTVYCPLSLRTAREREIRHLWTEGGWEGHVDGRGGAQRSGTIVGTGFPRVYWWCATAVVVYWVRPCVKFMVLRIGPLPRDVDGALLARISPLST